MIDHSKQKLQKYSKPIYGALNRFPELYKRQALQALDIATHDAIRDTADAFILASCLVLIEKFDFGTRKDSTRIHKFMNELQKMVDTYSDEYQDCVAVALAQRLRSYGIEYELK